ncbi:hypothetical protein GIB67_023588 [Kingdonia uniflora]|uniref:Uncharacterized protein n=1 Tax=Kingdonia uniflora TaxID=39325 RepID=A0A7J7PA46_9MAGN|nr:hypothetical protein GIB67_023588 [Kingdonia uniflora]
MDNIKVHLHYLSRNLKRLARTINHIRSLNLKVSQPPNYFQNYLFNGESTQHSQSDTNASIPVEAAAPQKEKGKERKKRAPTKQKQNVQVSEDAEFLDETDDAGMHWTDADFTCLARAWVTTSAQTNGLTNDFTFYQKENNAHKIYKGLNGGNNFKHREAYKILAREPRWANLRDDGLNHADPDGPPTPQSAGPNSKIDGSLYEGGSRPIGQKLYRKNIVSQKAMEGITASGSVIHALLDELQLEKMQSKEEQKQYNTGKPKWIRSKQRKITKSWRKT